MKNFNFSIFFLSLFGAFTLGAQCLDTAYVSVTPWGGNITLDIEDVLQSGTNYESWIIQAYDLDCNDINDNTPIEVSYVLGSDTTTCIVQVVVIDNVPPIVVVRQEYEVCLNASGTYDLQYAEIDNGSLDGCLGPLSYELSPSTFDASNIGDNIVWLRVTDEHGNWNETWMNVYVANGDFECIDYVYGNLGSGGSAAIFEKEIFLTNQSLICSTNSLRVDVYDDQGVLVQSAVDEIEIFAAGNYNFEVIDLNSNVSCSGDLIVYNQVGNTCSENLSPTDITWPTDLGVAAVFENEEDIQAIVEPLNLRGQYDFDLSEVLPSIKSNCQAMANSITKTDMIAEFDVLGTARVIRRWDVVDVINQNSFFFTQVIIIHQLNTLICDTNSNDSPLGDCGSGHTDTDDVEWPADITIDDARISPEQLILFSNVAQENAEPQFNTVEYTSSYSDKVVGFGFSSTTIERTWNISREDISFNIAYVQKITLNLNSLRGEANVNTFKNRPIANVELANGIFTDVNGNATVSENTILSPSYKDAGNNGLDILDLIRIQEHILDTNPFEDDIQSRIADINGSQSISAMDLVELRKYILLIYDPIEDWTFENASNTLNLETNNFIGYKLGDVDDSAILSINEDPDSEIVLEDVLLNNGQDYSLPVHFRNVPQDLRGIELHLQYDSDLIEVTDVLSEHENTSHPVIFNNTGDGELHIIINQLENTELEISENLVLNALQIEFKALDNSTIANVFSGMDRYPSLVLDRENYEKYYFDLDIKNAITSKTKDLSVSDQFSLYPNPTNGLINIISKEIRNQQLSFELFDLTGKKVFTSYGKSQIDVSSLNLGMYFYTVTDDRYLSTGKIIID